MNPVRSFFRIASPSCWCAAILFFFLPWVDIGCSDARKAGRQTTMSGAQVAWGGETEWVNGEARKSRHGPPNGLWETPRAKLGCVLLNLYFVGLVVFAISTPLITPCASRGVFGSFLALVLLACLFGGCALLTDGKPFSDKHVFLKWYYASYAANGIALTLFLLEFCCLGDDPRGRLSRTQP